MQNLKEPFRAVMEQYLDAVHSIADEREKKVADKEIDEKGKGVADSPGV